jgi:hypothetical protein
MGYFFPSYNSTFQSESDVIESINPKKNNMKRILLAALIIITGTVLFSCNRSVTPGQAAGNHYSHCRDMR